MRFPRYDLRRSCGRHLVKPVDYDKLLELLTTLTNGKVKQI